MFGVLLDLPPRHIFSYCSWITTAKIQRQFLYHESLLHYVDTQLYGGDLTSAPVEVQLAMIHGLALAGNCHKALEVLARLTEKYKIA